jgi:hypothetical protein
MNRVVGGGLPAQIWHEVMLAGHRSQQPAALAGTAVLDGPEALLAEPAEDDAIARALARGTETTVGDAEGAVWAAELMSGGKSRQ